MTVVFYILNQKFSFIGKILRGNKLSPKLVFFAFVLIFAAVMSGEFLGFLRAFNFLKNQEFFGSPLTLFILEEFFLLVFALFILSSVISGFYVFFKSADLEFLTQFPIKPGVLFRIKFFENIIISSWPLFVMGFPLILALGVSRGSGIAFYLVALLVFAVFAYFSSSVAALIDFAVVKLFRIFQRMLFKLSAVAALFASAYLLTSVLVPDSSVLNRIFQAENIDESIASVRLIEYKFRLSPSHWAVSAIYSGNRDLPRALKYLFSISAAAALLYILVNKVAGKLYSACLFSLRESVFYASSSVPKTDVPRKKPVGKLTAYLLSRRELTFSAKDFIIISRNYQTVAKAGFILFLLLIYLAATVGIGKRIGRFTEVDGFVSAMHLAIIAYFANALSLQFIFPSISLEGRGAWILWSSPTDRRRIFFSKFLFFGSAIFAVTEILFLTAAFSLGFNAVSIILSSLFLLLLIAAISAMSLFLGTYYADFHESNVDKLATSAGGLIATFFSLAYGLFAAIVNYRLLSVDYGTGFAYWFLFAVFVSLVITISSLYAGAKKIEELEVI